MAAPPEFDHMFVVMELFESDLGKLIKSDPPPKIHEDQIKVMVYNALCALNFMHTANVVHRDIKPANILIKSDCNVRLCDFSISRSLPARSEQELGFEQQLNSIKNESSSV